MTTTDSERGPLVQVARQGSTALLAAALLLPTQSALAACRTEAATPSASATAATGSRVGWKPCKDGKEKKESETAECGTLRVPVDWGKPHGDTFELALTRRKATDPSRRIGSLVLNIGGGPGADALLNNYGSYLSPDVRARFDVVGFDTRGSGGSHPLLCAGDLVRRSVSATAQPPRNQADFDRLVAHNAKLGADCRRRTGPLIDHLDTVSVVRDLDAIRAALGERKITYHGVSAGTLVGQQYAELFPQNIRAMVLDSNMDHSLDTRRFLVTEAESVEDAFNEFVRWCARERKCALHGRDVAKIWDGLMAKAEHGELRDPSHPDNVLAVSDLASQTQFMLSLPIFSQLAERMASLEAGKPGTNAPSRGEFPGEEVEYEGATWCQDMRWSIRDYRQFSQYSKQMSRVAPHMRQSDAWVAPLSCVGWPAKVTNPQHRLNVRDTPTLLMINGRYDTQTGYNWAVNVHKQIRRSSVLVTYEGAGHGVYDRTDCTRKVVDRYLRDLRVPANGTRCAAALVQEKGKGSLTPQQIEQLRTYSECLRANGIGYLSDPPADGRLTEEYQALMERFRNDPKRTDAEQKCQHVKPEGM